MTTAELLLHPIRLRVVQAFLGGRELTTGELRDLLPDIPTATLYRQVALLADGGVLTVVRERQARGSVERTYRLETGAASVGAEESRAVDREGHRHAFLVYVASLLAAYDGYLARDVIDLEADGVGFRQTVLNLDDAEFRQFLDEYRTLLSRWSLDAGPGRARHLFATVVMPSD